MKYDLRVSVTKFIGDTMKTIYIDCYTATLVQDGLIVSFGGPNHTVKLKFGVHYDFLGMYAISK